MNQIVNLLRNYLVDHSIIIIVVWISNSSKRVVITKETKREKESKHELEEIKKIVSKQKKDKSKIDSKENSDEGIAHTRCQPIYFNIAAL